VSKRLGTAFECEPLAHALGMRASAMSHRVDTAHTRDFSVVAIVASPQKRAHVMPPSTMCS
jgi:hypothetical protein